MALLLKAKPVVEETKTHLKNIIGQLDSPPMLRVILVGNDAASEIYVNRKLLFCQSVGASCEIIKLPENIEPANFITKLKDIVDDKGTNGCLVQMPLPAQLRSIDIGGLIPPNKDVDGFNYHNIYQLYQGENLNNTLLPCTPKGIVKLLSRYNIDVQGKKVVVIGRSQIVGKPVALLLLNLNATVTMCHSKTKNLKGHTKQADIIISAVGSPKFLTKNYFKDDASQVVVDVGISRLTSKKIAGDVDFESVEPILKAITPVPGGVGPMTISALAENLLQATMMQKNPQ